MSIIPSKKYGRYGRKYPRPKKQGWEYHFKHFIKMILSNRIPNELTHIVTSFFNFSHHMTGINRRYNTDHSRWKIPLMKRKDFTTLQCKNVQSLIYNRYLKDQGNEFPFDITYMIAQYI